MHSEFKTVEAGVLALQGAFAAHGAVLSRLGARVRQVRFPADLDGIEILCMPGGESTSMSLLLDKSGLREPLGELLAASAAGSGGPVVLATCAGAILLAKELLHDDGSLKVQTFGLLDATVDRNAFGRQVDSFEAELNIDWSAMGRLENPDFHGVFIRAPRFAAFGEQARPCGWLPAVGGAAPEVVLLRQGRILAATFHPELSGDPRLHEALLEMV